MPISSVIFRQWSGSDLAPVPAMNAEAASLSIEARAAFRVAEHGAVMVTSLLCGNADAVLGWTLELSVTSETWDCNVNWSTSCEPLLLPSARRPPGLWALPRASRAARAARR